MNPTATATGDFTCAFCGLACDDVRVQVDNAAMRVVANGCPISEQALMQLSAAADASPRVRGAPAPLKQAIGTAAGLLRKTQQPVLAGLATDIAGARAVMRLAQRCGAITDHMNFGAKVRNVLATQDRGWITTTFAEVKNRAELMLIVGADVARRFPRFFERLLSGEAMFAPPSQRQVIYLGNAAIGARCREAYPACEVLACDQQRLPDVLGVLRMLATSHPGVLPVEVAGVKLATLQALARRMREAGYTVAAWAAADFDFTHAELTVQRIVGLVQDLNKTTRAAALPLGGNDGDLSMNQVHVWQSGFALRSDFGRGHADYDPSHNIAEAMLARGEADALLWISSFSATRLPPSTEVPSIVLGRADMHFEREPEVFIPVGTPGVDHAGHFVRSDKVVTMRLGKLRDSALPSVAQVVAQIEAQL